MTGERIDHVVEARDHLARADKQGPNDIVGEALRMNALVHATLALVEQQRIANVLTIERMHRDPMTGDDISLTGSAGLDWVEAALGLSDELDEITAERLDARKVAGL